MSANLHRVQEYYDRNTADKLRDYVEGNARIERALSTVRAWAPAHPGQILDIGCGIGHTSARLKQTWPEAEVVGLDISPKSLEIARALFAASGLAFVPGPLAPGMFGHAFDLILLMDVYEHIDPADRSTLHAALANLLTDRSRLILTFPTPRTQEWSRQYHPATVQPIDVDVSVDAIAALAHDLRASVLLYQEVDIWNQGDYAHAVLARRDTVIPLPSPSHHDSLFDRFQRKIAGDGGRAKRLAHVCDTLGSSAYPACGVPQP